MFQISVKGNNPLWATSAKAFKGSTLTIYNKANDDDDDIICELIDQDERKEKGLNNGGEESREAVIWDATNNGLTSRVAKCQNFYTDQIF